MEAETEFPWMLALANAWRIRRSTAEDPSVLKKYSATFGEIASHFSSKAHSQQTLLLSSRPDFHVCLAGCGLEHARYTPVTDQLKDFTGLLQG